MIKFLVKHFISDFEQVAKKEVRERYGVLAGALGIICNIFLFAVKLAIGFLMNSIAITSDAFNNLSDMGSSVVTIIGLKMSNLKADKEHPFGHGRIEYISSLIVSFIIMLVGFELFKSSVDKIINPEKPELNLVLIIILILSVLVKVWMFSYNRYIGNKINSGVIKASATDSLNDVISTGAVIVSAILSGFVDFPIDAIAGSAVSVLVLYSGFSIAKETISVLLGNPPDAELVAEINERILAQEGIVGTHDLIVHDYGPGRVMASVHAEVPDDIDIVRIHEIIDLAEKEIARDLDVHIVIHMDPITVNCERTDALKAMLIDLVKGVDERYNIHDFRMTDGESNINLIFDLEVPCGYSHQQKDEIVQTVRQRLTERDERFKAVIEVDDVF